MQKIIIKSLYFFSIISSQEATRPKQKTKKQHHHQEREISIYEYARHYGRNHVSLRRRIFISNTGLDLGLNIKKYSWRKVMLPKIKGKNETMINGCCLSWKVEALRPTSPTYTHTHTKKKKKWKKSCLGTSRQCHTKKNRLQPWIIPLSGFFAPFATTFQRILPPLKLSSHGHGVVIFSYRVKV